MFSVTPKWKKKDNKGAKKTKAEKVKGNSIFSREGLFLSSEKSTLVFFLGPCFWREFSSFHELFSAFLTRLGPVQTSKIFMCRIQRKCQKSIFFPSFALEATHVKFDVWTGPSGSKRETHENTNTRCGSEITCKQKVLQDDAVLRKSSPGSTFTAKKNWQKLPSEGVLCGILYIASILILNQRAGFRQDALNSWKTNPLIVWY